MTMMLVVLVMAAILPLHSTAMMDEARGAQEAQWSAPVDGCLWGYTDETHTGVSLDQCKEKCVAASFGCNSIEWIEKSKKCWLSSETKETKPDGWREPCSGSYSDMIYLERLGIKARQQNIGDTGFGGCMAGWYDVQGQGVANDYCRWVGNCGCRGSCSFWSCALAGSKEQYSPKGEFSEPVCYFLPLGCWKDKRDRAIPFLEGKDSSLDVEEAIDRCFQSAKSRRYPVFALQDQGECMGGKNAIDTYQKYGEGDDCWRGMGNPWLNDVYKIVCGGINKIKMDYLALQNDGSELYSDMVHQLLPILLQADLIEPGEVGVAHDVTHPKGKWKYPWALRTGKDIITTKFPHQSVTINGTVTKKIGQRAYTNAKRRTTGLYAEPGAIVTITIPPTLVGKLAVFLGQTRGMEYLLEKSTQKVASPWGGLISIYLEDIDATTAEGQFEVQFENVVQAPYFVHGKNSNAEWNSLIKKQAAPWTIFLVPGQVQIYEVTERLKMITDIEKIINGWKQTFDIADDMLGIPVGIKPGEEQIQMDPLGSCWREGGCNVGGGRSFCAADPEKVQFSDNYDYSGGVLHEMGHGYCYPDLPSASSQMWAELIAEYIRRTKGQNFRNPRDGLLYNDVDPFYVLHRMVSYSKFSGRATDSYRISGYENSWFYIYRLPLYEFGWDTFRKMMSLDGVATKAYASREERLVDLYCQATGANLIPMFNFYNIKVSESIAASCKKLPLPDLITKYVDVANCILKEDITKCAKLPGFPAHEGICTLSGECNNNPDERKTTTMTNEFDLFGAGFGHWYNHRPQNENTSRVEENCLKRAEEVFGWCGNDAETQSITATFTSTDGTSRSAMEPPQGNCYHDSPRLLPKYKKGSSDMTPDACKKECSGSDYNFYGVQNASECWCGKDAPPARKKRKMSECGMPCAGDGTQFCGGVYMMNIFKL